jgi:hypothetical protein
MPLSSPRYAGNKRFEQAAENKPPISYGEVGEPVRILQQSLIELGYWMDISLKKFNTPDGIFGPETKDRVKSFQSSHGLFSDGIVGKNTMAKLDELLPTAGPALPPLPAKQTFTHRVRVHFRSLALTDLPISFQEANARMVYAQYGIYLEVLSGMSLLLSDSDTVKFEDVDAGECVIGKLDGELGDLHKQGLQGVGPNEVVIYFAKKVTDNAGKELNGCAATDPKRPAVVVSASGSPWTLGHELGHVLLGNFTPSHSGDKANLMFRSTNGITANPPGFAPDQLTAIRKSPFVGLF